mmetsp:Transcript_7585/g.27513  ORF Transcript_7585/g.27513 Transcript_7585/m.27513 type:complete len:222 (-) Transcript_7585:2000-2665(-)
MLLQSESSTFHVDCPVKMESLAPILTKMASTGVSSQLLAGTGAPIWAKMVARHTCRMMVLFPPMLGPVSSAKDFSPPRSRSFGTKSAPLLGWDRAFALNVPRSASTKLGWHHPSPTMLSEHRTSIWALTSTALRKFSWCRQNPATRLLRYSLRALSFCSSAIVLLCRISLSSLVWYLLTAPLPFLCEVSSQSVGTSVFSATSISSPVKVPFPRTLDHTSSR